MNIFKSKESASARSFAEGSGQNASPIFWILDVFLCVFVGFYLYIFVLFYVFTFVFFGIFSLLVLIFVSFLVDLFGFLKVLGLY